MRPISLLLSFPFPDKTKSRSIETQTEGTMRLSRSLKQQKSPNRGKDNILPHGTLCSALQYIHTFATQPIGALQQFWSLEVAKAVQMAARSRKETQGVEQAHHIHHSVSFDSKIDDAVSVRWRGRAFCSSRGAVLVFSSCWHSLASNGVPGFGMGMGKSA